MGEIVYPEREGVETSRLKRVFRVLNALGDGYGAAKAAWTNFPRLKIRFPGGREIKAPGSGFCRMPATKFSSRTFIELRQSRSRPSVAEVPLFVKETRLFCVGHVP